MTTPEKRRANYLSNREDRLKKSKAYYQSHKEQARVNQRARYKRNPGPMKAATKKWVKKNTDKLRELARQWSKANPAKVAERAARKRAGTKTATPAWADMWHIGQFYNLAKFRARTFGGRWHVDHIVPLRSPLVCGLHVECNLEVVAARLNQAKGNRYWPDMP